MDDEEDVVFENSPLERHLREVGFTDFEPEKPNIFRDEEKTRTAVAGFYPSKTTEEKRNNTVLVVWFGKIWRYLTTTFSRLALDFNERHLALYYQEYASLVLNSNVLCEEDLSFLQKFDTIIFGQQENAFEKVPTANNFLNRLMLTFSGSIYIVMAAIVCLIAIFASSEITPETVFSFYSLYLLKMVLLLLFSCFIWYIYIAYSMKRRHCSNMSLLQKLCTEIKLCSTLLRKSVINIQEMELICRGYTFVGPVIPTLVLQHAKDKNIQKKIYPSLRQAVFEVTKNIVTCVRKTTNSMVKSFPLCAEINNTFSYLASVSLDDIYHDFEGCVDGREGWYKQQDDLSLHSLKILCSVAALLQSELLSRFVITLSKKSHHPGKTMPIKLYNSLCDIFEGPLKELCNLHQSLQRSYHLYQCSLTTIQPTSKRKRQGDCEKPSKWSSFSNATHSLELHCQSALMKLASIRNNLDDIVRENDCVNDETFDATLSDIEMNFSGVKNNLESAMSCWDEGLNRLEKIANKTDLSKTGMLQTTIPEAQQETQLELEVRYVNINDSVDEEVDQVFEGYTDSHEELDDEQAGLSSEAWEKEKRELEESRHLMIELRSVLATKAKDPFVTKAGFVLPSEPKCAPEKDPTSVFGPKLDTSDDSSKDHKSSFNRKEGFLPYMENFHSNKSQSDGEIDLTKEKTIKLCSKSKDLILDKSNRNTDSLSSCEKNEELDIPGRSIESLNLKSSFAFSIAAAAAERSRMVGVQEELFADDSE